MVTLFLLCHRAVCCMSLRAEVPGDWGDPPAADETADQRLLPFHRGHARSSRSGMCWSLVERPAPVCALQYRGVTLFWSLYSHVIRLAVFLLYLSVQIAVWVFSYVFFCDLSVTHFYYNTANLQMKEEWAPPNEPSTAAELHQFQPWNPAHLSCKHSVDGIFSRRCFGCSSIPRMSFPPPSLMDKETRGTGEFSLWPEWKVATWNNRRRTEQRAFFGLFPWWRL